MDRPADARPRSRPRRCEAETLAKIALLRGAARGARAVLAARGGLLVHEDGDVETDRTLAAAA